MHLTVITALLILIAILNLPKDIKLLDDRHLICMHWISVILHSQSVFRERLRMFQFDNDLVWIMYNLLPQMFWQVAWNEHYAGCSRSRIEIKCRVTQRGTHNKSLVCTWFNLSVFNVSNEYMLVILRNPYYPCLIVLYENILFGQLQFSSADIQCHILNC